jgi:hypothetical protein
VPTFVKTKPAAAPPQAESAAGSGPHKPSKAAGKPARVADPAFPEGGPPPVIPDAAVRLCLKGINFNVDEAMAWEECEKASATFRFRSFVYREHNSTLGVCAGGGWWARGHSHG